MYVVGKRIKNSVEYNFEPSEKLHQLMRYRPVKTAEIAHFRRFSARNTILADFGWAISKQRVGRFASFKIEWSTIFYSLSNCIPEIGLTFRINTFDFPLN